MNKYLYTFPFNTYNNEQAFYEIEPLPESEMKRSVIFGGKAHDKMMSDRPETFLYLETGSPLKDFNLYRNRTRLCYLVWLATGLPAEPIKVDIGNLRGFEEVFNKHKTNATYIPNASFGGLVNDPNPISRVVAYSRFMNKLNKKDLNKFENALNTYIWAKEIERLPNPQLRYTLFMTLFLSSIDQLADNPKPKCQSHLICPDCKETINKKHETSHAAEIEKLIRGLLTGQSVDSAVKLVKKLYHGIRSKYIHDGLLVGKEKEGGFLAGVSTEVELVENMANVAVLNRKLLELFLQNRSK